MGVFDRRLGRTTSGMLAVRVSAMGKSLLVGTVVLLVWACAMGLEAAKSGNLDGLGNSSRLLGIGDGWNGLLGDADGSTRIPRRDRLQRPVLYWHPMKTGGTTLCMMSKENEFTVTHVRRFGFDAALNCKLGPEELATYRGSWEMAKEIPKELQTHGGYFRFYAPITEAGIKKMYDFSERNLVAYEPSWPASVGWKRFNARELLKNDAVWNGYYHVMSVRHPVERVFSHLHFEDKWRQCVSDADFVEFIDRVMNKTCKEWCDMRLCAEVHGQVDDFYVRHLSGTPANLTTALYHALFHVDHFVDVLAYPRATIATAKEKLGWSVLPESMPHARPGALLHGKKQGYSAAYPGLYARLEEYLKDDLEFYDVVMEKARRWCNWHRYCEWDGDDEETLKRRQQLWAKWTKIFNVVY